MKKSLLCISIWLLAFTLFSQEQKQDTLNKKDQNGMYCARKKNGKLIVSSNGRKIKSDITLENGTQVKTDGSVVKKDGASQKLKEGECVDEKGEIFPRVKTRRKYEPSTGAEKK